MRTFALIKGFYHPPKKPTNFLDDTVAASMVDMDGYFTYQVLSPGVPLHNTNSERKQQPIGETFTPAAVQNNCQNKN